MQRSTLFVSGLTALLLLVGCGGSGPQRFGLTGKVTLDGEPVENGSISFLSTGTQKPESAHGTITNGTYSIPADRGPQSGTFQVMIYWPKSTGQETIDPDTGNKILVSKEAIPAKYNAETTLTVDIKGKQSFDFELTSN